MGDMEEKTMTDSERAWLRLKCFEIVSQNGNGGRPTLDVANTLFKWATEQEGEKG